MTDKELMRNLKAETIGRLLMLFGIFVVSGMLSRCDNGKGTAQEPIGTVKNTSVGKTYNDSVNNINAVKIDAIKSRTK